MYGYVAYIGIVCDSAGWPHYKEVIANQEAS